MYCPGRDSIILSMDVNFKEPVFPDTKLIVNGEVINKIDVFKIITIRLTVSNGKKVLVKGKAKVKKI